MNYWLVHSDLDTLNAYFAKKHFDYTKSKLGVLMRENHLDEWEKAFDKLHLSYLKGHVYCLFEDVIKNQVYRISFIGHNRVNIMK